MSSLNLDDFSDLIERPDGGVRRDAEERRERLTVPPGALGRLDELGEWLSAAQSAAPVRPVETVRVVLFAGDHGVAGLGVSARPAGSAHRLVRAVLDGESPVAVLARRLGVPVRIVDAGLDCDPALLPDEVVRHRVRRGTGRIDIEDALTSEEAEQAVRLGMAIADEEADSGTDLVVLGDLSVGGTTAASALIAALCGTDASVVTGRGGAVIDDLAWMRKCAAIRDALRRARPVLGDQLELLATVGGADLAAMTGFLLQCAVRRVPVILDGVVSAACALVAQRAAFRAPDSWLAGQVSGEPAQAKALDRMALTPLLDHGVTVGEGTGALLALPLVQATAALLSELPERTTDGTATDGGADETSSEASGERTTPEETAESGTTPSEASPKSPADDATSVAAETAVGDGGE
ncbi:nicotinate-nucleotide--dimethylbenzimidazole phosphoribosyltransferase [Streptomyces sp. NBC_01267]|uniref:nicotinate-nucleotide--dimethylbenzimidazole phosphoribosyltransferase n=1 Tax=unclassified Streptomyces TaxID=2593676 RepID=UPI002DD7F07A|nr:MULTISPECIES: nicotinate-nucleotide--dimethylbenzimidazole phosphoribosyltransferase [unclassified Streptomyces]WSC22937.1 nicotinate-nucleotide--dimethylbenzimidazole phosphoribosyltransferase [Streptomyces sp. NBC_01766]WSV56848.1 nicotinate-nucleotide--dimethylbenzimidazole phosphoribosyltransferase [Streptomyces sp. NBC_01014]